MIFAQPELDKVLFGLIPMPNEAALYIAGIIGWLCHTFIHSSWYKPEN
jgi:hypothetical protein